MSSSILTASGQPPRQVRKAVRSKSADVSPLIVPGVLNNLPKETSPVESPDSHNDIGLILSHPILPVPECRTSLMSAGTDEPVRIKSPSSELWSASNLMLSHNDGAICHSSISLGFSPFRSIDGLILASCLFCPLLSLSDIYRTLLAICSAVVVFPHHFAPSRRTAPFPASFLARSLSAILLL